MLTAEIYEKKSWIKLQILHDFQSCTITGEPDERSMAVYELLILNCVTTFGKKICIGLFL